VHERTRVSARGRDCGGLYLPSVGQLCERESMY